MRTVLILVAVALIGTGAGYLVPVSNADDPPAMRLAQGVGPLPSPAVNPRLGEERRFTAPAVAPPDAAADPAAATGARDGVVAGGAAAARAGTVNEGHLGSPPLDAVPNPPAGAVPPPPAGAVAPPPAGGTNVAPGAPAPVPLGR
jgi:collagen type IV alpha